MRPVSNCLQIMKQQHRMQVIAITFHVTSSTRFSRSLSECQIQPVLDFVRILRLAPSDSSTINASLGGKYSGAWFVPASSVVGYIAMGQLRRVRYRFITLLSPNRAMLTPRTSISWRISHPYRSIISSHVQHYTETNRFLIAWFVRKQNRNMLHMLIDNPAFHIT